MSIILLMRTTLIERNIAWVIWSAQ